MLNQIVAVGRLAKKPELNIAEDGKKISVITLAVPRSFKNSNGEYDIDFIDCTLYGNVASATAEYCKQGDIIGIKGMIQSKKIDRMVNNKIEHINEMLIIAEKVTFLSSQIKED